jgi:tRNA threonylcarbamoyladenosine biosynthesis protein TsaE
MSRKKITLKIRTESAQQTEQIGRFIGGRLKAGDILALSGELGSGKTCFTSGLARGLGVDEKYQITSPTFTLMNAYPGRCWLFHFDVYRLSTCAEFQDLGFEEYVEKGVIVIEWAEKVIQVLPPDTIDIRFQYIDESRRNLVVKAREIVLKRVAID